jgi:hypothetical protein
MVTDNVDLDIEGIAGDGERAIAGAHSTEVLAQVEMEFLGKRSAPWAASIPTHARRPAAG